MKSGTRWVPDISLLLVTLLVVLAGIVGEQAVFIDTSNRNTLMRETAELIWQHMDAEAKVILQAYTDGINGYIEEHKNALPIEYKILRSEPEPWTPIDSLVWGNAISVQLSSNRRLELIRMQVFAALGKEGMNFLLPYTAPDNPITTPTETAESYVGLPEATAVKFIPDPFAREGRVYRTGDRVRFREDDNRQFIGRTDRQIKVPGHCIEPESIERLLNQHEAIVEAAVATTKRFTI